MKQSNFSINSLTAIVAEEARMEQFLDAIEELRDEPIHHGTSTSRLCEDMAKYYQPTLEDMGATLTETAEAELEFLVYQQMLDRQSERPLPVFGINYTPTEDKHDPCLWDASVSTPMESCYNPATDSGTVELTTRQERLTALVVENLDNASDRLQYLTDPKGFIQRNAVDVHGKPVFTAEDRAKKAEADFWRMKGQQRFKRAFAK